MENYEYGYYDEGMWALFGTGYMLFSLALYVLMAIGLWKLFEKAGKPGWAALVPVYNFIVVAEIVGKPAWWGVLVYIPCCVNFIFGIWLLNLLMKSFGKDTVYTVLAVFFPYIVLPLLGFSDAKYLGPSAKEAQNNPFDREYKNPFDDQNP
ncbi:DUF5684 domain-containing protein [Olivibacter sitiensis]|uniref:DUF5684 domain-containing protein n=1 Tax=Olivibacter sitiensis TaxID=376470 RepID=UPI000420B6AE|nr:DUF5684 domain-containing protein [Olivibacter sitiensis]